MRYSTEGKKRCLTLWNSVKIAAACFIMHLTTLAWCFLFRNVGRPELTGVEVKLYGCLATMSSMLYNNG